MANIQEAGRPCSLRVLCTEELVGRITGQLQWSRSYRTLACLGQVCRPLFDPAMDALWHHLRDLCPLIQILPSHQWVDETLVRMLMISPIVIPKLQLMRVLLVQQTLRRLPDDHKEWARFDAYAIRVHIYSGSGGAGLHHGDRGHVLSAQVLTTLATRRIPILPELHSLSWPLYRVRGADNIKFLKYFISPKIKEIVTETVRPLHFFCVLTHKAANLRRCRLGPTSLDRENLSELLEFLEDAINITTLELLPTCTTSPPELLAMANMPSLKRLEIHNINTYVLPGLPNMLFRTLEQITFSLPPENHNNHLLSVLRLFHMSPLCCVSSKHASSAHTTRRYASSSCAHSSTRANMLGSWRNIAHFHPMRANTRRSTPSRCSRTCIVSSSQDAAF
jgi:hypothetical protein